MALKRYSYTPKMRAGKHYATSASSQRIYAAVKSGRIEFTAHVLKGGERLESIAAHSYGDATLWWVIAAASGIAWGLQVPPGTLVRIPKRLSEIMPLIR